jgi:hypothetical protein
MPRHLWKPFAVLAGGTLLALAAGLRLEPSLAAQSAISAEGVVESKSGGFKFPDGTIQTTAAVPENPCLRPDPMDEMIEVGGMCIDKYETSVWSQPDGGIQYGVSSDDYPCSDNGQDCTEIYARSVAGVTPSRFITWFQAQRALANSGKRLPTNAEWQMAVSGTPDPGTAGGSEDCHVNNVPAGPEVTGERANCVSAFGAFDMVGNLWEWVADWGDLATDCGDWESTYGSDISCVGLGEGEINSHFPAALFRGGGWDFGAQAGPFAVNALFPPSFSFVSIGFRGAR